MSYDILTPAENTQEAEVDAKLDVMKDAVTETQQPLTHIGQEKGIESLVQPVYFTEGELIPWKSKWWRVKLLEINGERIIGLVMQKDTASAMKRAERKQRWMQQHPHATAPRV